MYLELSLAFEIEIVELRVNSGDACSTDKGRASINWKQQEAIVGDHPQTECAFLRTQPDHDRKLIEESPRLDLPPMASLSITFHIV
jgi:hypothetical protein